MKNDAMGTDAFDSAQARCAKCLNERRQAYIVRLKDKLAKLCKGDKQWWRINRELLNRKAKVNSTPPP